MQIKLENVRLSYPHLFKKHKSPKHPDSEPKYSAGFLIPKDGKEHKKVLDAINTVGKEKWGAKASGLITKYKMSSNTCCLKTEEMYPENENMKGNVSLNANSSIRPLVLDCDKSELDEDSGRPYGGCYVNAVLDIYIQEGEHSGIRCQLKGVQFVKDGEAFSSATPAKADDFDIVETEDLL